ncbi:response regulator [Tenacibaculum sp. ZS6-P6]|uniref:response regulator n=1 Tax=Tenacibaculum sp. ZS6-P6 TaxID=3447503 RepID=UPI003F9D2E7E
MKIVAIDDQKLVLLSIEKKLSDLGYEVYTAKTGQGGVELIDKINPCLVIVDINLRHMSGLEITKYVKESPNLKAKVIILSGETQEETIIKGYNLGADDFMKKPVSLNEIVVRVKRLIGAPNKKKKNNLETYSSNGLIREKCIGVVIPCYNEEDRLLSDEFTEFVYANLGYHLCFVNDGSTDNTLNVLNKLSKGREDYISVYDCEKNGGKAEAVRLGMLHLAKNVELDYIGFLDADLSTDFKDFDDLVKTIETTNYKIVSGSRISRMGANINKQSARQIISLTINYIIQKILGMKFQDTQCGAKILDKDIIPLLFEKKFVTRWLFDVEMFLRLKKKYGEETKKLICEQPLKRWEHVDGSKLSMKDSLKIAFQLTKIATHYR